MDQIERDRQLRYDEPADEWVTGLPIGNGRLGGMVLGRPGGERVAINEETLWAGGQTPRAPARDDGRLSAIRNHLFEGEYEAAQELCNDSLLGNPPGIRPYQPFCDLEIDLRESGIVEDYRRELDLEAGIVRVEYTVTETTYTREYFVSAPDDVLVVRLSADEPAAIDASIALTRDREGRSGVDGPDQPLVRGQVIDLPNVADLDQGQGGWGPRFEGRAIVRADGADPHPNVVDDWGERPDAVEVDGADTVTILVAAATDYDGPAPPADDRDATDPTDICQAVLADVSGRSYEELRQRHVDDHRRLFNRVSIDLGEPVAGSTDDRLAAVRTGVVDPDLTATYFQYGRYLLMASSRPGTLPANLQGIWNEDYDPAWHSCYTLDVNLEMNYWPAEVTNLSECTGSLVEFVDSMRPSGRKTAREQYGCDGFTAHVDTDLWRTTTQTVDAHWAFWPMSTVWLAQNLWEYYAFSGEQSALERIYPVLKEAATFVADYLVEHPTEAWLVTAPSSSPENQFRTDDGQEATVCVMPTMDNLLIRDLFAHVIEAADILNKDEAFAERLGRMRQDLPPIQISSDGTLQEWLEDFEEVNPGHRHISHLVGVYPADVITLRADPELSEAAEAALERRLAHGGGHTGWSCAWSIGVFARLESPDRAHEQVRQLLTESTNQSLLDLHPPFQIDGNFGGTAGIAEMLLGSHGEEIRLLPALPKAWDDGAVDGLRARGGYEVAISWTDGSLDEALITATADQECRVRTFERTIRDVHCGAADGPPVSVSRPAENVVVFDVEANTEYYLVTD